MSDFALPPEELPRLSRLLDRALDPSLEEPAGDREAFFASLEGDERAFEPLLRRLLASLEEGGDDLLERRPPLPWTRDEDPLAALDETGEPFPAPGLAIGPYTLDRELGRGGMGAVWLAARSDGAYQRQVALKLPHAYLLRGHNRARFRRERDILAALQHPHIARFLDAGIATLADGGSQPYLALEWVDGLPITAACRERRLPLAERLLLIRQVAAAVHYAHGRLVVHRDIKPSNVLVTADGRVQLLDFGIAKLLESGDEPSGTQLTGHGESMATPDYAAPEQVLLGPITVATDVYAIGVLLFELLTGRRPPPLTQRPGFPGPFGPEAEAPLASRSLLPGQALALGLAHDRVLARAVAGDLDAIVARALALDPARRYASAEALAADLERFDKGEPVAARRVGRLALAGKFLRRHRLGAALSAALALAVAAGAAGVLWQSAAKAREARRAAATRDFLIGVFRGGDPRRQNRRPRGETTARELVDMAAERIDRELENDPETRLELLDLAATIYLYLDEVPRAREVVALEIAAAEKLLPPTAPMRLDALLFQIWSDLQAADANAAAAHLAALDRHLEDHGLSDSRYHAESLLAHGDLARLEGDAAGHEKALGLARDAFARIAPEESGYAATLANLGELAFARGRFAEALELYGQALAAAEKRPDAELDQARYGGRRGRVLLELGRLTEARATLEKARSRFAATLGLEHETAWATTAALGRTLCRLGEAEAATALFASLPPLPVAARLGERRAEAAIQEGLCFAAEGGREGEAARLLTAGAAALEGSEAYATDRRLASEALAGLTRRPKAGAPAASR